MTRVTRYRLQTRVSSVPIVRWPGALPEPLVDVGLIVLIDRAPIHLQCLGLDQRHRPGAWDPAGDGQKSAHFESFDRQKCVLVSCHSRRAVA
jgi:hypothetical protein